MSYAYFLSLHANVISGFWHLYGWGNCSRGYDLVMQYSRTLRKIISFCSFILTAHSTALSTNAILRTYVAKLISWLISSIYSEAHALNTISQQLHHMGEACCLHDTGVQKLTLNMLCPFLTSPGEGRSQHYITQRNICEYGGRLIWRPI